MPPWRIFASKQTFAHVIVASALVVVSLFSLVRPRACSAFAFTPAEQRCRDAMALSGVKIHQVLAKTLSACHRDRLTGARSAGTNCNDVSEADSTSTVSATTAAATERASSRCVGQNASFLGYSSCPAPCDAEVSQITDFATAASCLACVVVDEGASLSAATSGEPTLPIESEEAHCHSQLDLGRDKYVNAMLRERRRCQRAAERVGMTSTSGCEEADPRGRIDAARSSARESILAACFTANLSKVDGCSTASAAALADCTLDAAAASGTTTFVSFYRLPPEGSPTTTIGTTTTTIILPPQDPACPEFSELTLRAAVGDTCTTNGDCDSGTCDPSISRCRTRSDLDTGWTGISHDSDITDRAVLRAFLRCGGPFNGASAEPCGVCYVTGVDAAGRSCRCANDNRVICDQPFQSDADDCGGEMCECYLGPPLPLSAGNTPVCVLNRFARDVTGTVNVDTGEGTSVARLASVVHLGETLIEPCPVCGGSCVAPAAKISQACGQDLDCDTSAGSGDGVCGNYDPVVNDGVRGGTCMSGENAGASCDVDAVNTTFPAPQGGGHSLDCFPSNGKNVSGTGLQIRLAQTTGSVSLSANILCGYPPTVSLSCPCGLCTNDATVPCTSNADCRAGATCERRGGGMPMPNQCNDGSCTATGGGEGECSANPRDKFCDAITRANGEGFISCQTNADCLPANIGIDGGLCLLTKARECFPDPISAAGDPDPVQPFSVSAFCIAPTASNSINAVAGLPGPARALNQSTVRQFCASDPNVQYVPGSGGCP